MTITLPSASPTPTSWSSSNVDVVDGTDSSSIIEISISSPSAQSPSYANRWPAITSLPQEQSPMSILGLVLILLTPAILFLLAAMSSANGSWCYDDCFRGVNGGGESVWRFWDMSCVCDLTVGGTVGVVDG